MIDEKGSFNSMKGEYLERAMGILNKMTIQTKVALIVSVIFIMGFGIQVFMNLLDTRSYLKETSGFIEGAIKQIEEAGEKEIKNLKDISGKGISNFEDIGYQMVGSSEENEKEKFDLIKKSMVKSISHMMVTGNAEITGEWMDGQKEIEGFKRIMVVRATAKDLGEEAFKDNKTIIDVNRRLGSRTFPHRKESKKGHLNEEEGIQARNVVSSKIDKFLVGRDEKGKPMITIMTPILNDAECRACHGEDHQVRGVLMVSVSREKTVSQMESVEGQVKDEKGKIEKLVEDRTKEIQQHVKSRKGEAENQLAAFKSTTWKNIIRMVVVALINIAAIVAILIFFMRLSVIKPIQETVKMAENIADGDLSGHEIDIKTEDEIGTLGKALNRMKNNLKDMISKVKESAGEVAVGSEDIFKLSDSASSGAEKQTSQITQVVTAVEEMSSTVAEVAKNSADAANSANKAKESAAAGSKVVQSSIEGMERIAKSVEGSAKTIEELGRSSNQIGEIVAVIDDIADQTNLLALNAAIEAARAGEQGRGFAVVADEVRKLAERTTKATKEIADMIKKIQKDTADAVSAMNEWNREVKNGVELSNRAGESLKQIVGLVQNVTDMINQIATATEEQSAASEEITSNIEDIAKVSKDTAGGASRSSEASKNLRKLAENLQRLVEQFRL
ncbi:MAG: methyl-accepting chemotaxis protein [Nitrospinae bacterium]|nr:methyl-accepting chemotaxis protein [Nitrospinota bacterium]